MPKAKAFGSWMRDGWSGSRSRSELTLAVEVVDVVDVTVLFVGEDDDEPGGEEGSE